VLLAVLSSRSASDRRELAERKLESRARMEECSVTARRDKCEVSLLLLVTDILVVTD